VGPTPPLLDLTEAVAGATYDAGDWAAAGRLARSRTEPEPDIHASADYRSHLVEVLTARGLAQAARHAAGAGPEGDT
jgi:carbon-monoxide dehydrogenase medium subunit